METIEVFEILSDFRKNKLSLEDLSNWVSANEALATKVLSRSEYLALKHSKLPNVYQVGAEKLKKCSSCLNLTEKQMMSDIDEYWFVHDELKNKQGQKILSEISKPAWYRVPKNRPGADSYYQCNTCGSIWALFMPDQAIKGGFIRVM